MTELATLRDLAVGRRVLELGAWQGKTTVALAEVAMEVWTVDHHEGDSCTGPADTLESYFKTLQYDYRRRTVVSIVGEFAAVLPCLKDGEWDLVLVDGDHDYISVVDDCRAARRLVGRPGVVVVHDLDRPEVQKATHRVLGPSHGGVQTLAWWNFARKA